MWAQYAEYIWPDSQLRRLAVTPIHRLFYRRHVKFSYFAILGMSAVLGLFVLIGVVAVSLKGDFTGVLYLLLVGAILPTILFLEAQYLIKPLAYSFVDIFEDHFLLNRLGKIEVFNFHEIEKVTFSYIPMLGGWYSVKCKNSKPRKFTVVLENSHYILDAINQKYPNLIDQKKLGNFRRTAIYGTQSWDRTYKKVGNWPLLLAKYLGLPLALAAGIVTFREWSFGSALSAAVSLNFFWGFFVYLLEEFFIGWKTRRQMLNAPLSEPTELSFVIRFQKIASAIYLIGFAVICVLLSL